MFQAKKLLLFSTITLATLVSLAVQDTETAQAAPESSGHAIYCVLNVQVETRNQQGTLVGTELYQKDFSLTEGGYFVDDFSTRTRFKIMSATLLKTDGEMTVDMDWFADVTVFNSVDVATSVTLSDGQKSGKAAGQHTFYNSSGSTTTTYSLICVEE